jgi:hypothetical protein
MLYPNMGNRLSIYSLVVLIGLSSIFFLLEDSVGLVQQVALGDSTAATIDTAELGLSNQPPHLEVGLDQEVALTVGAISDRMVIDDWYPHPPRVVTTNWNQVRGLGRVTVAERNTADTATSLSAMESTGSRLAEDEGELTASDGVTVTVGSNVAVVAGAGDIARCGNDADEETANLLDNILDNFPGAKFFTLGDNVYPDGTDAEFSNCYDPTWGRHKALTNPAAGNHDYHVSGASGYFNYFGAAAGEPDKGYYSYDIGDWHAIVLNSQCDEIGGCGRSSPQGQWLQADLAANPSLCTLAYWHKPRFSSGQHGGNSDMQDFWEILYAAGTDVVLNGHDHDYERFAPQDPNGVADLGRGIRQFVVGTGGGSLRSFKPAQPNSEVRNSDTYGVLKLILQPAGYDWEFVPIAGQTFTDSGNATCSFGAPEDFPYNSFLPVIVHSAAG